MKKLLLVNVFIIFFLPFTIQAQEKSIDYFLQNAKLNSPLLKDLNNQLSSLKLDSIKIKAGFLPQVAGNSNVYYAPVINGFGYDKALTNGQLLNALVTVNKDLFTKNRSGTFLQTVKLNGNSLMNQKALNLIDLERNITAQYISTWGDQQLLNLSKEVLQLLKKEDDLLKKLTQSSVFKQTDYLAFKVNLEQQNLVVAQNLNQLKSDLSTLQYLSGLPDTTIYTLAPIQKQALPTYNYDESFIAKGFEIDSLKTLNDLALLNLNYKPRLRAFADGGFNSSLPQQAYKNFGVSAGLSLNIPLYDGGQKKVSEQQIKLKQATIFNYKSYYRNQYLQQQNLLKNIIARNESLIAQSNAQLDYAKTLIEANELQLRTGEVRMTDYLLSVANYLQLRGNIIQNKINQEQAINQLHYFNIK